MRFPSAPLRLVTPALLLLVAACSGGDTGTAPPAPNPTATSIGVVAGDNQSAAPGSAVPVAPSVLVRDQNAQPVAGATVTFRVDSGGGSVQNATVTTGANGVASSGSWTLGAGRNRLRATVGALSPVFFTAVAAAEVTLATGSIGTSGGTVTVNRPGDPLNGLAVAVPSGLVSAPITLTLSTGDNTGVPNRPRVRIASPVITIASTTDLADSLQPIRITVPVATTATEYPVAMLFNRASGTMLPLPTVRVSATEVVTLARHINGARLDGTTVTPRIGKSDVAGMRTAATSIVIQLVIGAISYTDLAADLSTGYQSGTDDWEFDKYLTAMKRTGTLRQLGMAATSTWYFDRFKLARGSLNGRFQEAPGVEWSNPRGIRLNAIAEEGFSTIGGEEYQRALQELLSVAPAPRPSLDSLVLLTVKAGIFSTGKPYVLLARDSLSTNRTYGSLVVTGTRGSTLDITSGTSAPGINGARTISLTNGRFSPVSWATKDPETQAVTTTPLPHMLLTGLSTGLSADVLNQLWQGVFDNSIVTNGQPKFQLMTKEQRPVLDTLFIADDSTIFWVECSGEGCETGFTPTSRITPTGNVASGLFFQKLTPAAPWTDLNASVRGNGIRFTDAQDGRTVGVSLLARAGNTNAAVYGGWTQFVVKARRLALTPSPLRPIAGVDFTITASYDRPLPPSPTWIWDLGDGRTLTTTTNTLTTKYGSVTGPTNYDIKVTLRRGTTTEAIGRVTAAVNPPIFGWALRTATVQASTLPQGGIGLLRSDTTTFEFATGVINRLTGTPGNTALFVVGIANGGASCDAGAILQQAPSAGAVADTIVSGQFVGLLGVCNDPDFTGNLTMGPLGAGTIVGNAVEIANPNVIVPPGGSINATMAARNLSGTFVWNVRYSTGIATYTVQFTGVQVRPQ